MARARGGVWLVVWLACLVALFAAFALLARFVVHGSVNATSLATSVTRASGSAGSVLEIPGGCRRTARDRWSCEVVDGEGSGSVAYRVRMRPGSACWDASLARRRAALMPREISGCVHLWQWSLLSLG